MRLVRIVFCALLAAVALPAGDIIEEIVAKVNSEVITKSDLERERQNLRQEIQQQYGGNTLQAQAAYTEREKDLLRELIDRSLLLQRGKEMNLNVEIETVKRMDEIRKRMGLATLDDLERAVSDQGMSFEDYKTNIKNGIITQQVIGREVGGRIQMAQDKIKKFYDENKEKFNRPEQVRLREIFVSTEGKDEAGVAAAEKRAGELLEKVRKDGNFAEVVQQFSEGSTAKERAGDLGYFNRGDLAPEIEKVAFSLNKGDVSDLIRTQYGWLIVKVEEKHQAGIPPLAEVEQEITEAIYMQEMQPALRKYLAKLREDAYIEVKPGYVDTAGASNQNYARLIPQDITEDELIAPKDRRGRRSWLPPFRRKKS